MDKPTGYRKIIVLGRLYYWVAGRRDLVIRDATTGNRLEITEADVDEAKRKLGSGPWDDMHERSIILPCHISFIIKDKVTWKPAEKILS